MPNDYRDYRRIAGHPALDFVNTLGGARGKTTREFLTSYKDLAKWAGEADLVKHAEENPAFADEVLSRARALREAIYRAVTDKSPAQEDLFLISREAAFAFNRAKITPVKKGFDWTWPDTRDLDRVLWPVSRAAADLMTSDELALVRACSGVTCTWVFLDTSKNHRRKWCDMKDCGNRSKVRRFRKRSS